MVNYLYIIHVLIVLSLPWTVQAKMYKYVDHDGRVTYTNSAPPSTARTVITSKEIIEDPEAKHERLMQEKLEKAKEQQEREIRAEHNKYIAEQKRKEQQAINAATHRVAPKHTYKSQRTPNVNGEACREEKVAMQRNNMPTSNKTRTPAQQARHDTNVRVWRACMANNGLKVCSEEKNSMLRNNIPTNKKSRTPAQQARHDNNVRVWRACLESHGLKTDIVKQKSAKDSTGIINTPQDNGVINGEWDTQGRHYAPAGGGNAWRSDGVFMQKAAGGYINTQTGEFVPAH
jgi:hypothetical protein